MKINKKNIINEELVKESKALTEEEEKEVSPSGDVAVTVDTNPDEAGVDRKITVDLPLDANGNPATEEAKEYAHNAITDALDYVLRVTNHRKGLASRGFSTFGTSKNVLIVGLPGSSKTTSVKGWCDAKGLTCYQIDVRDSELEVTLNGAPFFEKSEDGKKTMISKAASHALDGLDDPNGSILFLDELNRQKDAGIRGSLLKLVAEKSVLAAGEKNGVRYFPNLLFAVAAINPYDSRDDGVDKLGDAEKRRYNVVVEFNSTAESAQSFVDFSYTTNLKQCAKLYAEKANNPDFDNDFYWGVLKQFIYGKSVATHILNYPGFKFDGNAEATLTLRDDKTLFNQATFTDAIFDAGELFVSSPKTTVNQFVKHLIADFKSANLLDSTFNMLKSALNAYRPAGDFKALVEAEEQMLDIDLGSKELDGNGIPVKKPGEAGSGDHEDTDHLFGGTADDLGTAGANATETAGEVEDRMTDFFGNLGGGPKI